MNKFGAKKTDCQNGHKHASAKEAGRCNDLHLLQRGGVIAGLQIEPVFTFQINGNPLKFPNGKTAQYRPDFTYVEKGVKVAEDIKSKPTMTEAFALRAALFRALWPSVELRIIT